MHRSPLAASAALCFLVASVAVPAGAADPATDPGGPRPMEPRDLWAMDRVDAPEISPDGRLAVFGVTRWAIDEETSDRDLWLAPVDGSAAPRRLTWREGNDGAPRWRPDGEAILFSSKRGEQTAAQLHLLPMGGGEARALTDLPIAPTDPRWSPDGKRIVFLGATWPDLNDDWDAVAKRIEERKEDPVDAKSSDTRLVRYWDRWVTGGRVWHFFELDVESGTVRDLTPGSERLLPFWGAGGTWDLSPDGAEIAFTANVTEPPYRTLNFDVFTMPASGGEATNRTAANPAFDGTPRYAPGGRYLFYTRNRRPGIAPDFDRLARLDRRDGTIVEPLGAFDAQPSTPSFSPDGRTFVFHAQDAGRVHVYRAPVAGGAPVVVAEGGTTSGARLLDDGTVVFRRQSFHAPDELFATSGGRERPLTAFNADRLAALELGGVENVWFEGADGERVQMWVLTPPGFDPGRKWPLLLLVHGGPHGAWTDRFHYRWNAALFASRGHVVAAVNFHGSTGRGQAFAESILGNHAEKPFEDLLKATDAMIATGYVDADRLAAAGGSYGGYMVSWILGHTDRFRALVNHAGVYDLMAQFASDYTWSRPNNYGAAPWEDPERIDRYSPSRYADRFETPTLILHGEKDYRVPYTQALNLHQVLTGKGVPSRLVVFPEANHWILKPKASFLWWEEVFGWIERYTGRGPTGAP